MEQFSGTDRYQVIKRLGSGGTGNVYLAYDRRRGHQVALKLLRSESPYSILRFKNEFRGLSELSHVNLIHLYNFHHQDQRWFFTMEYIDGVDFLDWVRPYNLLIGQRETDFLRLRRALEDLVKGVSTLHLAGHLHRDIKPSNVLIDKAARLTLLDFGLATRLEDEEDRDVRGISGTLEYMAPEQTDGRKPTPAADWYSVGVLLYEALTNELPFKGKPLKIALDKRLKDGPDPRMVAPNAPADLSELCVGLLRCAPERRLTEGDIMEILDVEPSASLSLSINSLAVDPKEILIGREHHLSVLMGSFMLNHGEPSITLLHGQSGMGKSALLDTFLNQIKDEHDVLVLRGRSHQREALTFRAFDAIFDGLSRFLSKCEPNFVIEIMPSSISSIVTLFPVLQNVQEFAKRLARRLPPTDPQELRKQAFAGARELLANLCRYRRVILCLDDAHHADLESFALLKALFKGEKAPIFAVVSYHSEAESNAPFLTRLNTWLETASIEHSQLMVDRLSDDDVRKLFATRLGDYDVADGLIDTLVLESSGNPFFVELLSTALIDLHLSGSEKYTDSQDSGIESPPLSLALIFRNRLKQIPKSARRILAILAVSDEILPLQVAFTAASVGKDGQRAISILKSELFVRTRQFDDVDFCEIYHERIRDAVLAELSPKQIARLKNDVSQVLAQQGSILSQSLFDHYLAQGDLDHARDFSLESAQRAAEQFAFERAAQLFEQARTLHAESLTFPPAEEGLETHLTIITGLAQALAAAGKGNQAAKLYIEASQGVSGDESLRLKLKASNLFLSSGYLQEGLRASHDVLTELGLELPLFGGFDIEKFEYLQLSCANLTSIDIESLGVEGVSEIPLDIELSWNIALTLSHIDQRRAMVFHWYCVTAALQTADAYLISRCLSMETVFLSTTGTSNESLALALAKKAYDLALNCENPHAMALARYGAGVAHFLFGRWGLASHFLGESVRMFREECQETVWEQSAAESFLVSSLAAQGEFKDLIRRVPEMLSEAHEKDNRYLATNLRTGYSVLIWLCADDPDSASRQVDDAMTDWYSDRFTMQDYQALIARVQISLYQNNPRQALDWFIEQENGLQESQLYNNPFIEMEIRILKVRTLIAMYVASDSMLTPDAITNVIRAELKCLFESISPWVIALGHYLKVIFDFHRNSDQLSLAQIETTIRALEGTGLHHYARTARILRGKYLNNEEGHRLVLDGLREMNQRGVQNPVAFLRIYLPGLTN